MRSYQWQRNEIYRQPNMRQYSQWASLYTVDKHKIKRLILRYRRHGRKIKLKRKGRFIEIYVKGKWNLKDRMAYKSYNKAGILRR